MLNRINNWHILCMVMLQYSYCKENKITLLQSANIIFEVQKLFHATGTCAIVADNTSSDFEERAWFMEFMKVLQSNIPGTVISHSTLLDSLDNILRGRILLVIPYSGHRVVHLLYEIADKLPMSKFTWLLFFNTDDILEEFFNNINIPFDCEFLVVHAKDDYIILTEVYRIGPGLPLETNWFGNCTRKVLCDFSIDGFYERRKDLEGLVLKVGTLHDNLSTVRNEPHENRIESGSYYGDIWIILENKLKFKSEFHKSSDGSLTSDGSWNGLIAMIIKEEVHVANENFWWTTDRMTAVKFLAPLQEARFGLYINKFRHPDVSWAVLLMPLKREIWYCNALSVVLMASFLFLTVLLTKESSRNEDVTVFSLATASFLKVSGIICNQAEEMCNKAASARIIILCVHAIAIVLLTSYSASLIAHIVNVKYLLPFRNFQEFFNDGTYEIEVEAKSGELNFFKESNNPLIRKIYDRYIKPHEIYLYPTEYKAIEAVCGNYKKAWFGGEGLTKNATKQLNCNLLEIPDAFVKGYISMAAHNNSPLIGIMRKTFLSMHEGGLFKMLRQKYHKQEQKVENQYNSVTLIQVSPIFMILGFCIVVAMVTLVMERLIYSINLKKRKIRATIF